MKVTVNVWPRAAAVAAAILSSVVVAQAADYPTHPITLVVGEPIRFTEADLQGSGRELYQGLSDRVMAKIVESKTV